MEKLTKHIALTLALLLTIGIFLTCDAVPETEGSGNPPTGNPNGNRSVTENRSKKDKNSFVLRDSNGNRNSTRNGNRNDNVNHNGNRDSNDNSNGNRNSDVNDNSNRDDDDDRRRRRGRGRGGRSGRG